MGNTHAKPHPRPRNKKQVHWKAADRPSPPGKPYLAPESDLTPDLVTILWAKPFRDGGSPITGYLVEHRRTGSPHWVRATPLLVPFPELSISGLEPGWRYQFRVRAENAVGLSDTSEVSEPLTVTLQKHAVAAPKFTEELKDVTVLENDKVEFAVHFMGQPTPKICWYKDGFEIFSSRRTRILTENDRSILTIHQSALSDEGEIKCTATNKAGHASTKARLILEAPPSIRLPRQYEDGLLFEIGEVLKFKVSVAGRPTPLVFWSHNGETIQNNDRCELEYVDKCSILKLGEATRSDRGEYTIKAVNKIGEDVASFLVTITDKPSPPGRARVVMTLGRSVTLSWSTPEDDGGCKIGNYIVEYYRLGWNMWLKAATSRQLTTILGDLIEGSEYKFRIKAESPYGISDPGEESDVVFIPDPKRGITSPQARSRSQPKDIIEEITAPVAVKRKKIQPRSQSSQAKVDAIANFADDVPRRPERTKIKSPPKTPDQTPLLTRKEINTPPLIDRASLARELAYGSPEIKMKKAELGVPLTSYNNDRSPSPVPPRTKAPTQNPPTVTAPPSSPTAQNQNRTPSPPLQPRTPSPNLTPPNEEKKSASPQTKRGGIVREKSFGEDSEFMLVLYPNANQKGMPRSSQNIEFDFDDYEIPPPLSLSAPELGAESPLFENLKLSASSTELLHERAMIRLNEAMAAEEEEKLKKRRKFSYDGTHTFDIPKIQINSKDDQEIVGLERKTSRRKSSGGIAQQQLLWAQRRFSLKSSNEFGKLVELTPKTSPETARKEMVRQRSESEKKEEEEFEVRAKLALQKQSSLEKRTIEVVDEEKWLEDYEESLSESESGSSEDERDFDIQPPVPSVYSDEDEEIYHPGLMSSKKVTDEPFEILTKKNPLPDPNFIPKPILKKTEDKFYQEPIKEVVKEVPATKTRSHSPMPHFRQPQLMARERSKSLAQPTLGVPPSKKFFQRSFSLDVKDEPKSTEIQPRLQAATGQNISIAATLGGITAASIVIPQQLLQKRKDEEEAKVVVDHYTDIVQNYGQRRKSNPQVSTWKEIQQFKKPAWESLEEEEENWKPGIELPADAIKKDTKPTEAPPKAPPPEKQPQGVQILWSAKPKQNYEETKPEAPQNREKSPSPSPSLERNQKEKSPSPPQNRNRSPSPSRPLQTPQRRDRSPSPGRQRGRSINHGPRKSSTRSKTPSKSPARLENWSGRSQRKSSPSPMKVKSRVKRSPSPIPLAKPKPKLKEIMTQTSIGLELNYSSDSRTSSPVDRRRDELIAKAEVKVRSFVDYLTDLAMFVVACWLYLFSNELLAIPVLLIMVYRQLKNEISKRIPKWIVRRFTKNKTKK